ncbi:hypothetical protein IGK31_001232 [Enterococcus sp. DIV1288f]|uniref:hypothetical protein n=1 Tax=Enterococcus sp. DIV1288f TaxID=2774823 RepID=UPI003F23B3B1
MKTGLLMNITKTFLYLSSFFPLFILLVLQNIKIREENKILNLSEILRQFWDKGLAPETFFWFGVIFFIIASTLSIFLFFMYVKGDGTPGELIGSNFERADTLGYIVTYIVPLISMDIKSYRSLLINFILFFIIGIFYIKNDQFFMNPIFNLLGYNILSSDGGCTYITKLSPRRMREISKEKEDISLRPITDDIYVVKDYS